MLEKKENKSLQIIIEELKDAKNPFVIFDGSLRSLVLLHLTKQTSVLCRNIESEKKNQQYIEKMRKLWKLRLIREDIDIDKIIKKYNIDKLFSYDDIKAELSNIICCPIQHFDDNDIWNYIKKYNLPYCSIYDKSDIKESKKEEEIKKRFKELGYL